MSEINIPDELQAELAKDSEAKELFLKLSPSHQREYINWIIEAKKESTRAGRVVRVLSMVKGLQK